MFGLGKKDITKCVVTFQHSSPTAADDFVGIFDITFTGVGAAEYAAKWEEAKQAEIARAPEYIKRIHDNIDFIKVYIEWDQKIIKALREQCEASQSIKQHQEIITRDQWALECLSIIHGWTTTGMD